METGVERQERVETTLALERLNADFCHFLDHDKLDELVDLFSKDADYSHGKRYSKGRTEIRELFTKRTKGEQIRTSRHLQTGLRFELCGPDRATGSSVCLTFAVDGPPPATPATPFLVADFIDEYVRCEDGRWRIQKRHIERIFTATGNTGPVGLDNKSYK